MYTHNSTQTLKSKEHYRFIGRLKLYAMYAFLSVRVYAVVDRDEFFVQPQLTDR